MEGARERRTEEIAGNGQRGSVRARGAGRLSPLDAAFLYFERPNQQLYVGCVAEIEGHLPYAALLERIGTRLATLPRYRQRPVRATLDLDRPRWEDDPDFDLRRHVRRIALPAPGGSAELREVVESLYASPLDPNHPLWGAHLVEGLAGGGCALFLKMHHCMVDGVSGAQVLELVTDAAADEEAPPAAEPSPAEPQPHAVARRPTLAGGLGALLTAPSLALERAREASEVLATLAELVGQPSDALPFNGTLGDRRSVGWTALPLDALLAVRGRAGCTVNDVVLTVIAGALHRYVEQQGVDTAPLRVRAVVPVSVRREQDHLTLGNLVTAMLPRLPIGPCEAAERLAAVRDEMRALKGRGQARAAGLVLSLVGALPAPLEALFGRLAPDRMLANTVCTNVPGPKTARYLAGRRVVALHPVVPLFQSMGLEFAILSYAGSLSIAATADPTLVPDLDRVTDALRASAGELIAAYEAEPASASDGAAVVHDAPRIAELMSRNVLCAGTSDSLLTAYRRMQERRIRHLPIVDGAGRLVGIVSQRDVLAAAASSLERSFAEARLRVLAGAEVAEVMETHLAVALPDEPAAEVGRRMIRNKIGCLPVVDANGALVGIVTEEDFVRWAADRMEALGGSRRAARAGAGG